MAKIQTQIPAARVPIADQDGLPTREWFRYFSDLYTFTGIGQGPTVCGQFLNTGTQTAAANTPTPVTEAILRRMVRPMHPTVASRRWKWFDSPARSAHASKVST